LARIKADSHAQKVAGLIPDCKIVDMRHVELSKMILLDDEFPVAVVTFQTTEIICFKNKKGEVKLGAEDNLVNGHYIFAFTKSQLIDPDAPVSDVTDGWLILQWARMTR
jgi:import inner membrane translocase subunit TIM44